MIRPGREQLSGKVEVDETFVGGPGRGQKRKNTVIYRGQLLGVGLGSPYMSKRINKPGAVVN